MTLTKTATPDPDRYEGVVIHFLKAGSVVLGLGPGAPGAIFERGSELTLTHDIIEANRDRLGSSWIEVELAKGDDSERIGLGPWPESVPTWEWGSAEHEMRRKQALAEAFSQPLDKRDAAVAEVRRIYGASGVFENSHTTYRREPGEKNPT